MLFSPLKKSSFGLKKDKFISVSIVMSPATTITSSKKAPPKSVDINNLFSDVWTKKIQPKKVHKKQVSKRVIHALQKKIAKSKNNTVDSFSKKIETLEKMKSTKESQSSSSALEVNEYLAKIQAIVYQYFRVPPNSEGQSVKTVIELDPLGKVLDFRVLQYSENEALNREADRIRERIIHVIFPKNPKHKATRTIVILISKE